MTSHGLVLGKAWLPIRGTQGAEGALLISGHPLRTHSDHL